METTAAIAASNKKKILTIKLKGTGNRLTLAQCSKEGAALCGLRSRYFKR